MSSSVNITSDILTDFPSRSELIHDFCSSDQARRTQQILSSKDLAEKLHLELNEALKKIEKIEDDDADGADDDDDNENDEGNNYEETDTNSTNRHHHPQQELTSPSSETRAEKTLVFNSPTEEEDSDQKVSSNFQQNQKTKKNIGKRNKHQQLLNQKNALEHELQTLRKQQQLKKLGIHYKCAEMSRLRNLSENILPRAKRFSGNVNRVAGECRKELERALVAARERETELRKKCFEITSSSSTSKGENADGSSDKENNNNNSNNNSTKHQQKNKQQSLIDLLEKSHAKLEHEKQRKLELISTFEKKILEHKSVNNMEKEIKTDMQNMRSELKDLRHQERSLRHILAADAVRRVLDARHKPLQLRGRNAHARLEEAMAFLKAEVVHFGHDIRPVAKALSSKDHENMFKQAHNELKLIVGLMLPSSENVHAQFQRKQGQTWPLTVEALEDRFPPHKIDTSYIKLQEMVVAWDSLSKSSQEQLTTAHDVVNNAEVLLMFARHVGDLYAEKRNQLAEKANKVASLSTGDSGHHLHHHQHHTSSNENSINNTPRHHHHSSSMSMGRAESVVSARSSGHNNEQTHHHQQSRRGSSVRSLSGGTTSEDHHHHHHHQRTTSTSSITSAASPSNNSHNNMSTTTGSHQLQQQQHKSGIPTTPKSNKAATATATTTSAAKKKNVMMTSPSTAFGSGTRRR